MLTEKEKRIKSKAFLILLASIKIQKNKMEEFKVGDEVIWLTTGKRYKIIASKTVPHVTSFKGSNYTDKLFPNEGMDFIIRETVKAKIGETIEDRHIENEMLQKCE